MSKITLDNLSDNLKAYLEGLGLSEEQVVELLTDALSDVNGYLFNKTVKKYKDCYYSKEFVLNNTGVINNVHVYGNTVVNILSRYIDNANIVGDGNFIWLGEGHQYDLTNGVFTIINKSLVSDVNIQLKMVSDGSDFEGNVHAIDKNSYKIIDVPEGQCISTFYNSLKDEDLIDFIKNNIIILRGEYSSEFIENIEKIPTMISVGGSSEFIHGLRFNNLSKNGILINTDFTNNDILEGNLVDNEYCKLSDFIPVDYNNFIEVRIDNSYEYEMQYYVYDERYNYKGGTNWVNFFKHHIVSENGFIRVAVRRKDGDAVNINPSIIKFDTNYYLNLPGMLLHSLPNGIRDEILKVSNNYYLIRRCGFIKLNGEENWAQVYLKDKCIRCMVPVDNLMQDTDNVICESDKLLATSNALWEKDEPHIDIDGSNININLPLDLLETADYNGFIKYLKENNVCVVYGLNKPYVELISNIDFYTHDGDNEFIIETYGIPIKFDFDVNTSLEEEMIVAKEKLITLENKVNELFQSANNGKELIANAIGEPVSADDTFSAMSDKINDMKSDLINILLEKGVNVNSQNTYKELLEILSTLNVISKGNVLVVKGIDKTACSMSVSAIGTEASKAVPKRFNITGFPEGSIVTSAYIQITAWADKGYTQPGNIGYIKIYRDDKLVGTITESFSFGSKSSKETTNYTADDIKEGDILECYLRKYYDEHNNTFTNQSRYLDIYVKYNTVTI